MPCIHGFDENNCPSCRILKSTLPQFRIKNVQQNLKPESPLLKQTQLEREQFIDDIMPKNSNLGANMINQAPRPKLISDLPNFENNALIERLNEIDVTKSDVFGISKKVKLESPEFIIEDRE